MELTTLANAEITISSRDIASLTNKRHANVLRDIEIALESTELKFESSYKDSTGRELKMYLLPKNIALGIVSGYSFELRMKIINRLEELELANKPAFAIPQTLSQALMLAASQADQIEQQQLMLEVAAPKVEFYDAVTGSEDTIDIGAVAKVLNIEGYGRTKLFAFLRDKGLLRHNNEPYQLYCDKGYFRVIESRFSKPDGSNHVNLKTVVYQKGLEHIRKLILESN